LSRPRPTHSTTDRKRFPSALHLQRIPGSTPISRFSRPVIDDEVGRVLPLTLNSHCLSKSSCLNSGAGARLDIPWASVLKVVSCSHITLVSSLTVYAQFFPHLTMDMLKGTTAYTYSCKGLCHYRHALIALCRHLRLGLICQFEAISNLSKDLCSENYLPEMLYSTETPFISATSLRR